MIRWAWPLLLSGCFRWEITEAPLLDCFELMGQETPAFEEGVELPIPTTPKWCGPALDAPPKLPAPRAPGACRVRTDVGIHQDFEYDDVGRPVRAWFGVGSAQWLYEGDHLVAFVEDAPASGRTIYRFDGAGRLASVEGRRHTQEFERDASGALVHSRSITVTADATHFNQTLWDPRTGAPIESRSVDDGDRPLRGFDVRWDPETGEWVRTSVSDPERAQRWRCDRAGERVFPDVRVDAHGRWVRQRGIDIEGRLTEGRRHLNEDGRLTRETWTASGQDDSFAYDAEGNLGCIRRDYAAVHWPTSFLWPPLRDFGRHGPPGHCTGACWFREAPELPWNDAGYGLALMRWARGRVVAMRLNVAADADFEAELDLDAAYDAQGRLVRERYLGAWSIVNARYDYACDD